jgi:peptide chain release factor 2
MSELNSYVDKITVEIDELEIKTLLSEKFDTFNCIFSINAGAGGTDAQDWAQILFRMYTRYFEIKNFAYEIVDSSLGEEAGLKSATIFVKADFAYGYLKAEAGVHRLVRMSPFNANGKRHTSFAAVDILPELNEDYKEIELDPTDLKIETFRSSGAGGQHVNKTESGVRITHIPTGLVAQSQNSRSQNGNKELALKILTSRLIKRLEEEHLEKIKDLSYSNKDIAWGNQIRSYVFHPYKLVKDLRTNYETSDLQKVMDGDLDPFIMAFLKMKVTD